MTKSINSVEVDAKMSKPRLSYVTSRRDFCRSAVAVAAGSLLEPLGDTARAAANDRDRQARQYLQDILYTREELESLISGTTPHGEKYHPQLGWIHADRRTKHGADNSLVTYRYDATGSRRMIMYRDQPCRINTYGDSFTHCDQVSDGETWQEVLAAHLIEPVRNYGVGGYSVYQAYLRMVREERKTPAKYIIFNVYSDDHYRNLHSWRFIRTRRTAAERQGAWGPPMPFLKVNPATGEFREYPNPCPTVDSFSTDLRDIDWVVQTFQDDFVLRLTLAHRNILAGTPERSYSDIKSLAQEHRFDAKINSSHSLAAAVDSLYTRAGLWASMQVINKVEEFVAAHGKKVLYVLSYGGSTGFYRNLESGQRFDQPFIDFLQHKQLNYVDLLLAHHRDKAQFNLSMEDYLKRYYVGHYNLQGNVMQAFAIKDKLVDMLEPTPIPYAS